MRAEAFAFGFVATLLAAAAVFAVATVTALLFGHDRLELNLGSVLLYRFINEPGLTEVHVGPLVLLAALAAGLARMLVLRSAR